MTWAPQEVQGPEDYGGSWDLSDHRGTRDHRESSADVDLRVRMAHQGSTALPGPLGLRVLQAFWETRAKWVILASSGRLDQLVNQGSLDHRGPRGAMADPVLQGLMDPRETREMTDFQDHQDRQD